MMVLMGLSVNDVRSRLRAICQLVSQSHEVAHIAEDALHADVLAAIAQGTCEDPKACAQEALRTAEIKFQRGCSVDLV